MIQSSFKILVAFILVTSFCFGCKDINNVTSSEDFSVIKSVIPAQANYGAQITIGGSGFGEELKGQKIFFNETSASIESLSDSTIQTSVPSKATSGPITVIANGDTLLGPTFTIDTTKSGHVAIDNVSPSKGRVGQEITISGEGFTSNAQVYIDKIAVPVLSTNDTLITAKVSAEVQTGPVAVVADDDTAMGPLFTVIRQQISGISAQSGSVGTDVTISGSGFSKKISENIVTFNGTKGSVETASESELLAIVPEGATSGPVSVKIAGYTANGPTFSIQQSKSLQVNVQTKGTNQDDAYTISVSGKDDRIIKSIDEVLYNDFYKSTVQVALKGIADNCRVEGENPRTISLSTKNTANTTFIVDCTIDLRGKIVYTTDRFGGKELFMEPGNGSPGMRITETTDYDEDDPAISPDGLQIAFINTKGGRNIFVMDSDGSDIQKLTTDGWNIDPSWSPDGSKIVFAQASNSDAAADLFIMDSDGNNIQNITNTGTARESNPDWSPDGSLIVYERFLPPDSEIFTIQPDGSNKKQITNNDVYDFEPEWSPSGDRIAFVRDDPDTGRNVHIMNNNGSGAQKLTPFSGTEASPSWSPDGSKMVYSRYTEGHYQISVYSVEYDDILNTSYTPYTDRNPHWNYK